MEQELITDPLILVAMLILDHSDVAITFTQRIGPINIEWTQEELLKKVLIDIINMINSSSSITYTIKPI